MKLSHTYSGVGGRHLSVLLVVASVLLTAAAPTAPYTRLYVFGDSYSDIGEGYLDGNGPTAVEYLARRLGLTLVPSNTPEAAGKSLDFAVSGAQTGRGAGHRVESAILGVGMQNQVDDFAGRVHCHAVRFDPQKTLFVLAGGLNDKRFPSETTVRNLEREIRQLYSLGGRHFSLALLPTAIPAFSFVGIRLNPELRRIPGEVAGELPGATLDLSHWGLFFDEVMRHPRQFGIQFGIEDTVNTCAGRAIFHQDATPCATPDAHFYYHSGHPSTAVHRAVGDKLYAEVLEWTTHHSQLYR